MDPDLKPERRNQNKAIKLKALIIVTALFALALIVGDAFPRADRAIHLTVIAFMGARIFLRGV